MEIGVKVDIFALGVLAFIMCFQKPPFESRLSAINKQYFLPEDHNYSKELVAFIEKCFVTNPENRMSAT
jgi:serine/threonine protein kinase